VAGNPSWAPEGIDTTKASAARVYDWWLGGVHNFRVDQDAARSMIAVDQNTRTGARAFRGFLIRAVRCLAAEEGIRQFLDIGSGIPTEQNVHQVAHDIAPGSKVVYVDSDDVAVAHSRAILAGNPDTAVIHADLREPEAILSHPETRRMLDFTQPVAIILSAVLHFIPDSDNPDRILETLRSALAPGSFIAISHSCRDARPEIADKYESAYSSRVTERAAIRTRTEIARFFTGLDLLEPGLVWTHEWRPDSATENIGTLSSIWGVAGVGKYPSA
jgi:SAM-dependent methyltransferase